jgi:hypothetical protein
MLVPAAFGTWMKTTPLRAHSGDRRFTSNARSIALPWKYLPRGV